MERKIGEIFEYESKKLQVKESASSGCDGCFFVGKCFLSDEAGQCKAVNRTDRKNVIFVEVQEQPQKTEEIKERKVGEVFEYQGKKLKVAEELVRGDCVGCCFFERYDCGAKRRIIGECEHNKRNDNHGVIFVDIIDELEEQPQEQAEQPKELNLCEILKNCPEGTELWSDNYGIVKFVNVVTEWDTPIRVKLTNGSIARYTEEGWCDKRFPANCLLWPSRDCRDWTKFTAPWYKKEKFDPKTLKPFDRVLVKNEDYNDFTWGAALFSHLITIHDDINIDYLEAVTTRCTSSFCIPYNDDTKHLVGTKDEAPVFYRYWED